MNREFWYITFLSWRLILASIWAGQKLVLYVNAAQVDETVAGNYDGAIRYGSEPLLIGTAPMGYNWIGKIDEVMIFNRVLTDHEVERVYQRTP